jgi:hypothetical protein
MIKEKVTSLQMSRGKRIIISKLLFCCISILMELHNLCGTLYALALFYGTLYALDDSGRRSETPGKFRNVVLEKDGED